MSTITISVAGSTHVGRVRTINEDAFVIADLDTGEPLMANGRPIQIGSRPTLLALSDGMGGHNAGEVASELTLHAILVALRAPAAGPIEKVLQDATNAANTAVRAASRTAERRGMGATLTAVLSIAQHLYVAEVGDSRAYVLRDGSLRQLTRDQSLVQALVDAGALTPEAARSSPHRNVIVQAIGVQEHVTAVVTRHELHRGDRLLICCDGLSNALADAVIADVLGAYPPLTACERLIDLANQQGGEDNLTAIVGHYDGEGLS